MPGSGKSSKKQKHFSLAETLMNYRSRCKFTFLSRLFSLYCTTRFNPIAPTFVKKALKSLMGQEFRSRSAFAPDSAEIDQLIEMHEGDIRAVINALQFMCYLPSKRRQQFRKASRQLEKDREGLSTLEER